MDDNDSELDYISSVDPFKAEKNEPSVDAPDEKALERVMRVLEDQIKLYHTISGVKLFPKRFSADTRLEMADHYVKMLVSLSQLVSNAIEGIKEKQYNGPK